MEVLLMLDYEDYTLLIKTDIVELKSITNDLKTNPTT